MTKFESFCTPKKNLTYERHCSFTILQKQGETIDQFLTEFKSRAKTCEVGALESSLVKNHLVRGMLDNGVGEKLLKSLRYATSCTLFDGFTQYRNQKIQNHRENGFKNIPTYLSKKRSKTQNQLWNNVEMFPSDYRKKSKKNFKSCKL